MTALELWNFVHFVGLAFGLGGATIATIISSKAAKDKSIAKVQDKLMPPIIKLIWFGLVLLIISGAILPFYITWPLNKTMLIIKHIFVVWIVIFGVILGIGAKKRINLAWLGKINLFLWYLVTLISAFV